MFFYVFRGDGNPVYGPEFARGALDGLFAVKIHQVLTAPALTITLEGRADNATGWTPITTFSSITTIGVKTLTSSSLTQLLRYKFEVTGASETSGVAIELFAPQWRS